MADPAGLVRVAARASAACTVVGAGLVIASVVGTRRLWFSGYVSEAGVPGSPQAWTYRIGVLAIAVGLLLLAAALARLATLPALLLVAAGVFAIVSGSVSCSAGCPLPPYESATVGDLVHGGASIIAVGATTLAIAALALLPRPGADAETPLRRLSVVVLCGLAPLVVAVGLAMLLVGRGGFTGVLERAILLAAIAWTLLAALRLGAGSASIAARR